MASILDSVQPSEWGRTKSRAFASMGEVPPFSRGGNQIQIVSRDVLGDLLQVRLRLFGGAAELIPESHEFLFANPPIMAKDGTRSNRMRRRLDGTAETILEDNYQEDLMGSFREMTAEAARVSLMHGHHSTTLTVFPDPGNPGTTSCDGGLAQFQAATWAAAHDAASANQIDFSFPGVAGAPGTIGLGLDGSGGVFSICRALFNFDTSSLSLRSTILAATLSFVSPSKSDGGGSLSLILNSIASDKAYAAGDYASFSTVTQAADKTIASVTADSTTYNDFVLTTFAGISLTGITHLGIRHARDVANLSTTVADWANAFGADQAGTTQDPKLVITSFRDPAWSLTAPYYGGPHQPYRSFRSMILT